MEMLSPAYNAQLASICFKWPDLRGLGKRSRSCCHAYMCRAVVLLRAVGADSSDQASQQQSHHRELWRQNPGNDRFRFQVACEHVVIVSWMRMFCVCISCISVPWQRLQRDLHVTFARWQFMIACLLHFHSIQP